MAQGFLKTMTETFKRNGQGSSDWLKELKALTRKDANDFATRFREQGVDIEDPSPTVKFAGEE